MNSQGRNRKSSAASLSLTDGTEIDNNGKSPTYTGQNNGLMQDGKSANTEEMNAFTPSNGENTEIKTVTPDVSRCESIISTMDDIFSELDKNEDEVHEKEEELERQRRMYRPDKNMEEESSTKDITAFGPVSRNRSGTQKQSKDFNQNVALDTGLNVAMDEDDISWGDVIDGPDKEEEKKLDVEVGEMKAPRKVMIGRDGENFDLRGENLQEDNDDRVRLPQSKHTEALQMAAGKDFVYEDTDGRKDVKASNQNTEKTDQINHDDGQHLGVTLDGGRSGILSKIHMDPCQGGKGISAFLFL